MSLLSRFQVAPGQHRPKKVRNGSIVLALLLLVLYAGYTRQVPLLGKGGTIVEAAFQDASNVRKGTAVRIRGVDVGQVDSVEVSGSGRDRAALVRMRIDDEADVQLLRSDARATIYWRTLLGRNMYVELDPGTAAARLGGTAIPKQRTAAQVEIDRALEPLDARGRRATQTFSRFLDDGFGNQRAAARTIERVAPSLRPLTPALRALRGQSAGDLGDAVRGLRDVSRELDRDEARLGNLIDSGAVTLGVTAARRSDLSATLQLAPGALTATRTEMVRLRGTLDRLDPLADDLRPGARTLAPAARSLSPALDALRPALRDARPLLADLSPALRQLNVAARDGDPLIRQLMPTVDRLRDEVLPLLLREDDSGRLVYQLVGPTISGLASLTQNFDANGHDVAFQAGVGARALEGIVPCSVYLADPTQSELVRCDGFLEGLNDLLPRLTARAADSRAPSVALQVNTVDVGPEQRPAADRHSYWQTAETLLLKEAG